MEPRFNDTFEHSLERVARRFEYPPTPDIAGTIGQRTADYRKPLAANTTRHNRLPSGGRLAWLVLLITLVLAGLFAIPRTRAAVLSLFARIGAIDIFIDEAAPTATPAAGESGFIGPPPTAEPTTAQSPTPTVAGRVDHSLALFELGEPVTPEEAQQAADFAVALPPTLGTPDEAYTHRNVDLPAVTFVWRVEGGAPLSLTEIGIGAFAMKMVGEDGVHHVRIGDRPAVWIAGPHTLQLLGYTEAGSLLIESNVLIWAVGDVTYRLEGELSQAEMTAIAESLSE